MLSKLTYSLCAATLVGNQSLTVRSALVTALGPNQALVVCVLNNGQVYNRMIEVPVGLTLTELGQANDILAQVIVGKPLRTAGKGKGPSINDHPATEKLLAATWTAIKSISKEVNKVTLTTRGEEYLFAKPEFQRDVALLAEMLDYLKESDLLADAINTPSDQPQTITIGRENRYRQMHQLSVIRQSFFVGENEAGVIALIGPTRMSYDESVPLIQYTARALSEALTRYLG